MKSKILLPILFLLAVLISPSLMAQNDEYYRPDSLRKDQPERKEVPPVERKPLDQKPVLAEKEEAGRFQEQKHLSTVSAWAGAFGVSLGTLYQYQPVSPMAGYELTENPWWPVSA
jgi:hypothetical protein